MQQHSILASSTQFKVIVWNVVEELSQEVLLNLFSLALHLALHVILIYGIQFLGEMISECSDNCFSQHSLRQLMDNVDLVGTFLSLRLDRRYSVDKLDFLRCLLLYDLVGSS